MKDLFGQEVPVPVQTRPGGLMKRTKTTIPNGYAAPPGTGPSGQTCGSCAHLIYRERAGRYLKCELRRPTWTGGRGTDVLARAPACRHWAPQLEPPTTEHFR